MTKRPQPSSVENPESPVDQTILMPSGGAEIVAPLTETAGDGPTSPAPDTALPEVIGEFRILRRLGRGGMGEVLLAEQTSLGRQVALKVMRKDLVNDEKLIKRFRTEAMAAANLNHPNIVQVYLVGEADGLHYIAQEYVDGPNLRDYLVKKGPASTEFALHVMRQACAALQKAGEVGVIHRDIKPENIMVTKRGQVKVADFGLARLTLGAQDVDITQVGVTMGTPTYMSPEQVSGKSLDPRSDLYSLGVTCYHMLAGRPPFRGETALAVAVKHLRDQPQPLNEIRKDAPLALCKIVHMMMAKKPEDRFPDAAAVIIAIRKIGMALQQGTDPVINLPEIEAFSESSGFSEPIRVPSYLQMTTGRVAGSLLLAALVGGGLGVFARPSNPLEAPLTAASSVKIYGNAAEQLANAMLQVDNFDAFEAVITEFPNSEPEVSMAKEQLALLHLRQQNFAAADQIFAEFRAMGASRERQYATGLAGKAIIFSLQGDYKSSNRTLQTEVLPYLRQLDPIYRELLFKAYRQNREKLGEEVKEDLEALFADPEDEPAP